MTRSSLPALTSTVRIGQADRASSSSPRRARGSPCPPNAAPRSRPRAVAGARWPRRGCACRARGSRACAMPPSSSSPPAKGRVSLPAPGEPRDHRIRRVALRRASAGPGDDRADLVKNGSSPVVPMMSRMSSATALKRKLLTDWRALDAHQAGVGCRSVANVATSRRLADAELANDGAEGHRPSRTRPTAHGLGDTRHEARPSRARDPPNRCGAEAAPSLRSPRATSCARARRCASCAAARCPAAAGRPVSARRPSHELATNDAIDPASRPTCKALRRLARERVGEERRRVVEACSARGDRAGHASPEATPRARSRWMLRATSRGHP